MPGGTTEFDVHGVPAAVVTYFDEGPRRVGGPLVAPLMHAPLRRLHRALGCARNILSARLKTLVDEAILSQHPYRDPGTRQRFEYRLTDNGLELFPAIVALMSYVTDGIESAISQAKSAAGDKNVMVHGAETAQECLRAGVLEEMQIHLIPVLLGQGRRLFDHLGARHIELELARVIEAPGVTHLRYRVVQPTR